MSMMPSNQSGTPLKRVFGNRPLLAAIARTARPYRGRIAGLGVLITVGTVLTLVPPLLYRTVIDHLIRRETFAEIVPLALAAAVLTVAGVLLTYGYTALATSLGRRIIADLQVH